MDSERLQGLSAEDARFLRQEGPGAHMHVGDVALLEGPPPPYLEMLEHVRSRLRLVPRYRQHLAEPPLGLGAPRWTDDASFNLSYHVRHTGLPKPGDDAKLHALVARVFSQRLDRTKPLWELWIVEHLAGGGWALVSKTHHALVDGVAGVDLMTTLFDETPEVRPSDPDAWVPRPEPTAAQLASDAIGGALAPQSAVGLARRVLGGAAERVRAALETPERTPLNARLGPHRRYSVVDTRLEDFRAIRDAFGGTVNDVVLAVVAGALRRWLHERGARTEGLDLQAGVPVATRDDHLAEVLCPLPIGVADPIDRLGAIAACMADVKHSAFAQDADAIAAAPHFAPPTILARAARLTFDDRACHVLVTNVPGPRGDRYVLGRRLERTFPVPSLTGDRALAVAVMSYAGSMGFGLLADYDAVGDLDVVAGGIEASLEELRDLAAAGPLGRRQPTVTRTRARARAKRESARRT
jgi:diacylglycerol O-acyltransferase